MTQKKKKKRKTRKKLKKKLIQKKRGKQQKKLKKSKIKTKKERTLSKLNTTTFMCLYVDFYDWIFSHNGHWKNLASIKTDKSFQPQN
jgi:hypothetical protein